MGNNQSKPPSSGELPSPTVPSRGHSLRTNPSRRENHHYRRASTQSPTTLVETVHSVDSPHNPSPHSTLSPPNKPVLHPYHAYSVSAGSSPNQRPKGETKMGNLQSHEWREKHEAKRREGNSDLHSNPVQVPVGGRHRQRGPNTQFEPSAPPKDGDYAPLSNLNFPPRMPLPIQEEVYTPGSPILTPEDLSSALHGDDVEGTLPHHTSLLSHTTIDDEDDHELDYAETFKGKTVPTRIVWPYEGTKVYITGTFAGWSKKYRMHRAQPPKKKPVLEATLDLPPGTHHVKFIVDGEMRLSQELPTAVDYTNILVNYIEVSADDIPKEELADPDKTPEFHPPLLAPVGIEAKDFMPAPEKVEMERPAEQEHEVEAEKETEKALQKEPSLISTHDVHFGDKVPEYLLDLDRDEKTHRFQRAANHVSDIPTPPSLPLFLSKSILNGTLPMKDDSSVLSMPNHTVLNHLATSSIKNDVLATSLTTRYKRKYVTTITYRPTTTDE